MKIIKILLPLLIAALLIPFNGCDEFENLEIGVPLTFDFTVSGSNDTYNSGSFCLDTESEDYRNYQDKIKDIAFAEAQFRCISISDPNATVNLNIQVFAPPASGTPVINFTINNFKPADYINGPYTISFSQNQIEALNTYLGNLNNKCIRAVVVLSGLNGTQTVSGVVDVLLTANTDL